MSTTLEGTRLLERIRAMAMAPSERRQPDVEELQNSILQHLIRLLNTRQGSSIIAQDYGMPDFSSMCTSDNAANIASIENILTRVITRYEPRLKDIQVRFHKDRNEPFKISFALTATMNVHGLQDDHTMYFQTVLTPNGRISVRRYRDDEQAETP